MLFHTKHKLIIQFVSNNISLQALGGLPFSSLYFLKKFVLRIALQYIEVILWCFTNLTSFSH